ncbi:MAG: DUF1989 domain-containing protein [Rhizobiales bacterium]|nr:DUF1989 domain-containing protein [Hyphomicrobiales bacterium]
MGRKTIIPAGEGRAFEVATGESVRVVDIEGSQVVDCWAFDARDAGEFLSGEHTRSCIEKLWIECGDTLYSNRRHPFLTIVEDTSPGTHDYLMSACDDRRYELLGHVGPHRSCAANLLEALAAIGRVPPELPAPFNIFQNVVVGAGGRISIEPPGVRVGDSVTLRAERDLVVVFSACPMDIARTNGPDGLIKPVLVEVG